MTDKIDLNLENGEAETAAARKPWVRPVVQRIDVEGTEVATQPFGGGDSVFYDPAPAGS
jgi:hypothetical protein